MKVKPTYGIDKTWFSSSEHGVRWQTEVGGLIAHRVLVPDTRLQAIADALEMAWVIIANANNGDWDTASDEWRKAAEKWRDEYHRLLGALTESSDTIDLGKQLTKENSDG